MDLSIFSLKRWKILIKGRFRSFESWQNTSLTNSLYTLQSKYENIQVRHWITNLVRKTNRIIIESSQAFIVEYSLEDIPPCLIFGPIHSLISESNIYVKQIGRTGYTKYHENTCEMSSVGLFSTGKKVIFAETVLTFALFLLITQ